MTINVRQGTAGDGGFIIKNNMHITRRELESLALIGMGLNNYEVAERLGVSVNTVRNHIWNLMQKLEANSRAHAIILAVQNGIIEVKHERSLDTYVPGFDKYVLCILCGKAALVDDYKDHPFVQGEIGVLVPDVFKGISHPRFVRYGHIYTVCFSYSALHSEELN